MYSFLQNFVCKMEKRPNLLIEKCLKEMIKKSKNPNVQKGFKKALVELRKYPLPLKSGRECSIIIGFGDKICNIVDEWLDKRKKKDEEKVEIANEFHKQQNEFYKQQKKNTRINYKDQETKKVEVRNEVCKNF